jgi:hypothetical protein
VGDIFLSVPGVRPSPQLLTTAVLHMPNSDQYDVAYVKMLIQSETGAREPPSQLHNVTKENTPSKNTTGFQLHTADPPESHDTPNNRKLGADHSETREQLGTRG